MVRIYNITLRAEPLPRSLQLYAAVEELEIFAQNMRLLKFNINGYAHFLYLSDYNVESAEKLILNYFCRRNDHPPFFLNWNNDIIRCFSVM